MLQIRDPLARLPRRGVDSVLSYAGVVKRWECDRNDHWNVQFYVRAFQMASEVLATALTGANPGSDSARIRHYRFHGELFCPEPMLVRSSRIEGGAFDGHVVHWMEKGADGSLCATAIEAPAYPTARLPGRPAADLARALPRSIDGDAHSWRDDASSAGHPTPLGTIRPGDVDHTGDVNAHELAARVASASHHLLGRIGFTAEWIDRTNCNRMAVEMKVTRHGSCRAGDGLAATSWLSAEPGGRVFSTTHRVVDAATGAPCATVEQRMLVIDLGGRRPVRLPDFVLAAAAETARRMAHGEGKDADHARA